MYIKKNATIVFVLTVALLVMGGTFASMQERNMNQNSGSNMSGNADDMIGNITRTEFERQNAAGAAAVAAITPSNTKLSKADRKLMMEVAMGGMMQLEISRAALAKVTSEEARILAQSEVDEQTAMGAKLREIAAAKGETLPTEMNSKTQSMINKMQDKTGSELDMFYVRESGVKGHEKLDKTMTKVQSKATDDTMRSLASAAIPVVRLHLQVSRAVVANMSGSGNNRGGSMMNSNGSMNSNMNRNSNSNRNSNRNSNSMTNDNR
jgi:putative membrane protein